MKKFFVLASVAILSLLGCTDEQFSKEKGDEFDGTNGYSSGIKLGIKTDASFVELKSSDASVDVSDFTVTLYKADDESIVKQWAKFSEVPAVIALSAGRYKVVAESNAASIVNAGFDTPHYRGEVFVIVEPSKLSEISIVCTLENIKVSVIFSEGFLKEIYDAKATVSNGSGALEMLTSNTKSAFFSVTNKLIVVVTGKRISDNEPLEEYREITNLKKRQHHIITLNAIQYGSAGCKIDIDNSTIDNDVDITMPEEGGNDSDDGDIDDGDPEVPAEGAPIIEGRGFDINQPRVISNAEASSADVTVDMSAKNGGIKELWVTIDSPELTPEVLGSMGIPQTFDLANLEDGSDLKEAFIGLGLITNEPIAGKASSSFSIGAFVGLLSSGTGTQDHKFVIKVVDMANLSTTKTLNLRRIN